jgi:hypothetical protein
LRKSAIDDATKDLTTITGRKPVINLSRKSVSNFKLRKGQPIGCRVTLRRDVMYEFFDRLVAPPCRGFAIFGACRSARLTGGAIIRWDCRIRPSFPKSTWTNQTASGDGHHPGHHRDTDDEAWTC